MKSFLIAAIEQVIAVNELDACRRVRNQGTSARTSAQQRDKCTSNKQKMNSGLLAGTNAE